MTGTRGIEATLVTVLVAINAFGAPPAPSQLFLRVRENAGVARTGEVVRSGVPLPRGLNLTTTSGIAVVDGNGNAVPAEFQILARWNSGLADVTAPIQWLLVAFPATVSANATATYQLVFDGSVQNPNPAVPLRLTRNGNQVVVDTGVAVFTFGGNPKALFDQIQTGGPVAAGGGAMTAIANGQNTTWSTLRGVTVEHSGPLSATVIIDGAYDLPPVGNGGLGSHRRYRFTAGSPTAIVEQEISWEGDLCQGDAGTITCGTAPNGVLMTQVRDDLPLQLSGPLQVTIEGSRGAPAVTTAIAAGQQASVRQLLRSSRTSPPSISVSSPLGVSSGSKADGALLAVRGAQGTVAIALDHMHRYEPQALRVLSNGDVAIDIDDDQALLGTRQGMFATLAVGVLPATATGGDLDAAVWAPLNHPLHAWPDASWWAASDAVSEVPVGTLPVQFSNYDTAVHSALTATVADTDSIGVCGLMTFGLFPRLWGDPIYTDEVDCGGGDPTPSDTWDDLYWCATWTDVVDTLERGAATMRNYFCSRRPAAPCQPDDPPTDQFANLTGRVATQWFSTFRFVGLASEDASFLDDYRANLGRAVTQQYVAVDQNGTRYGFMLGDTAPVTSAGTNTTDQLWMTTMYDMNDLVRLQRDTNDAPIGDPPIRPSDVLLSIARSFQKFGSTVAPGGDGTAAGPWPNQMDFTWSGARIGGTLVSVKYDGGGSDPLLYETNKGTLTGPMARAAVQSGDPLLLAMAADLTTETIAASIRNGSPLGKEQAEFLSRLHATVANLSTVSTPRHRAVRH